FSQLDGSPNVGAGGDASQDTFFFSQPAGHGEGIVVGHLDTLDNLGISLGILQVKVFGNEPGARALNLVRAWFQGLPGESLRNHRRIFGFDFDRLEGGFAGFDDFIAAGNGTAGADGGDEDIDLAGGIIPDFLGGGFAMDFRVGGVIELLGDPGVGSFLGDGLGPGDGALHALGAWGED